MKQQYPRRQRYTKAQRHAIYKEALEYITDGQHKYICGAIGWTHSIRDFPELLKHKPDNVVALGSWFKPLECKDPRAKRIAILKSAIKETAPKRKRK